MTLLFDTALVAPEERFEYWCAAQRHLYHPLLVRRSTGRPFWARIYGHDLHGIRITRIVSEGSTVARTPATIAEMDTETFTLILGLRGRFMISQADRVAVCEPGEMVASDSSRPYVIRSQLPIEALTFAIPKLLLRPHADRICGLTATSIPGGSGRGKLAASYLRRLVTGLEAQEIAPDDADDLAETVVSLVCGIYAGGARGASGLGAAQQRDLLARIKSYIAANLADPGLDPERIARAHYISRRHLYSLFEQEGPGVQAWIRGSGSSGARATSATPPCGTRRFSRSRRAGASRAPRTSAGSSKSRTALAARLPRGGGGGRHARVDGGALGPELLRREPGVFGERLQLRPLDGGVHAPDERSLREAAVGAADHVVAPDDAASRTMRCATSSVHTQIFPSAGASSATAACSGTWPPARRTMFTIWRATSASCSA